MEALRESLTPKEFKRFNNVYNDYLELDDSNARQSKLMMVASTMDDPKYVRILICAGVSINLCTFYDNILFNVRSGEVLRELLSRGAEIQLNDDDETPLFEYVFHGRTELVRVAIELGMDVNHKNENQQTPLHDTHLIEIAEILLANGANREAKDLKGRTPAAYIRKKRYNDIADYIDNYQDIPDTKGALEEDM